MMAVVRLHEGFMDGLVLFTSSIRLPCGYQVLFTTSASLCVVMLTYTAA
jgi:hypothetical protein